jgi:hypothetical protein
MNKDKFYLGLVGILLLVLFFLAWRIEGLKNESSNQADDLKKSIIASDSLVKESEGRYAKLVDYYKTEKDLVSELKGSNKDLYTVIKKQDERLLSLTSTVLTLKSAVDEGFGKINPNDSNLIDIALKYPSEVDPFIKWDGSINKKSAAYRGNWTFGKLPIQIVVTEEKRGTWKHRIVGPDWFIVDSLQVNSIPPDKYVPTVERKIQFMLGGSYFFPANQSNLGWIGVGAGVNAFKNHSVFLTANTRQEFGVSYYYQFHSVKRTK